MSNDCQRLHALFQRCQRHTFPYCQSQLPKSGIYVLFEHGERGHNGDRIVRIGTHTGFEKLRSRLSEHFVKENKDRSIFRKNIGRCFLRAESDPYASTWEYDSTSKKGKELYGHLIDKTRQIEIEHRVSEFIQQNLSFAVVKVPEKEERLHLEGRMISSVSCCDICFPSPAWLGLMSPNEKIRRSGLWQVNELWKEPLAATDLDLLEEYLATT